VIHGAVNGIMPPIKLEQMLDQAQANIKHAIKTFNKMSAELQMQYDQDAIMLHLLLALLGDLEYVEANLVSEPIL
jgi:hypothetical protein